MAPSFEPTQQGESADTAQDRHGAAGLVSKALRSTRRQAEPQVDQGDETTAKGVALAESEDMPLPTNPQTVLLMGIFILMLLVVLYLAADLLLPIVLAIVLKLLLQPLVRLLERLHIPRSLAAAGSILILLMALAGTISALAGPASSWAGKLPSALPQLRDNLVLLHRPLGAIQDMVHQLEGLGGGEAISLPQAPSIRSGNLIGAVFSGTATVTAGLFTTILILFYLLVSGETFMRRFVEILPRFRDKRQAVELSIHVERDLSAYLITVTLINAVVGLATGLEMWACGVMNPLLWGVVAFVLNFVPILGPMVGIVIFLAASVLSFGVSWLVLLPVGLYLAIHIAEGEIITPMLLAKRFTINPVAVILALVFWYWMWGVPGAVLAVPMLAIAKIIADDIRPLRAFGHFLEG
ncbi:MAG TPA: AI-2E family transporter [Acetobacteraceae bacterium]|nr:AI-2E family transporter [Acetobacteraceae bacterium]